MKEQGQRRPYPLLVVGDDAAHEVGVGVAERGHQLGERLLVELAHGAEHALLGLVGRAKGRLGDARDLVQPHDAIHWGDKRQGLSGPGAGLGRAQERQRQQKLGDIGDNGGSARGHQLCVTGSRSRDRGHCAQAWGPKATNSSSTRV